MGTRTWGDMDQDAGGPGPCQVHWDQDVGAQDTDMGAQGRDMEDWNWNMRGQGCGGTGTRTGACRNWGRDMGDPRQGHRHRNRELTWGYWDGDTDMRELGQGHGGLGPGHGGNWN